MSKLSLFLILLLGFFTRFYKLESFPPSLNWDEISHAYTAYSILNTGQDQWGQVPLFNFRAYGDYPTTINMYLTLPFVKYFGLNPITTRLPTAILSFLFIPISYLFVKNKKLGLLIAFLVAISPWTVFTGRAVYQSTVAQTIFFLGIILLLKSTKNKSLLPIASLIFWLSAFAYHSTKIVVPLIFFSYLLIFKNQVFTKSNTKNLILSGIISSILAIALLINLTDPNSRARGDWVFIINQNSINYIEHQRNLYQNSLLSQLVFNRYTYLSFHFLKNYLNFLNPLPLFISGSNHHQYNIPGKGILYSVCLPFFYLGLLLTIKKRCLKFNQFILAWFVLGMLPAALTTGDFPVLRLSLIWPLPFYFIALALLKIKKYLPLIILITLIQFGLYWKTYTTTYTTSYSSAWQYGYQQVVDYIKDNYDQYQTIYVTKKYGEPHQFILFYWPWPPQNLSHQISWDYHDNWYWVNGFDKFKFINDWEISTINFPKNSLLITSPTNYKNGNLLKTIPFLDNSPAFDIVSYE